MTYKGVNAYKTSTVNTADPVTLVSMLYDGATRAIRKARLHHENGNREGFYSETERTSLILGELLAALDMEQGDLPRTLSGIYTYCMARLTECTFDEPSNLDEVERHISRIANSWKTVAAGIRSGNAGMSMAEGASA